MTASLPPPNAPVPPPPGVPPSVPHNYGMGQVIPFEEQPPPKQRKQYKIEPPPGGRLEQYLVSNKLAYDASNQAKEREKETKEAIKSFILSLFENNPEDLPDSFYIAADPHGRYPAYTMSFRTGERVDTTLLETENPEVYRRYLKPIQPSWELRESNAGGRRR